MAREGGGALLSFRAAYSIEHIGIEPSPANSSWETGILYGSIRHTESWSASISAGLSLTGGVVRDSVRSNPPQNNNSQRLIIELDRYHHRSFTRIGYPIEMRILWKPYSNFGVGICYFINYNSVRRLHGITFVAQTIY